MLRQILIVLVFVFSTNFANAEFDNKAFFWSYIGRSIPSSENLSTNKIKIEIIKKAFSDILSTQSSPIPVELLIVSRGAVAVSTKDKIIIHEDFANAGEEQLYFVLAHEYAHIKIGHLTKFSKFVDESVGKVNSEEEFLDKFTDHATGYHKLSHKSEFEADDESANILKKLGMDIKKGVSILNEFNSEETSTHPASHKRVKRFN